jgi:hypothetical protein
MFLCNRHTVPKILVVTMLLGLVMISPAYATGSWEFQQRLSTQANDIVATDVAVDENGTAHVVWSDEDNIYHRTRVMSAWSDTQRIASGTAPNITARPNGGIAMAFVVSVSGGESNIYYTQWHQNHGWDVPINVSNTPNLSVTPSIAVRNDGRLAIAWSEQSLESALIYTSISVDGTTWSMAPVPHARGQRPVTDWDGQMLVVAWEDEFDLGYSMDIFVSQQQGTGWTLPTNISASPFRESTLPTLAASGDTILLAWQEHVDSGYEIHLTRQSATGWSIPSRIADADAYSPAIASEMADNGYLLWTTHNTIRYRRSAANVWLSAETVAEGLVMASGPSLTIDSKSKMVHAVWLAPSKGATTNDVWYSRRSMLDLQMRLMLPLVRR